MTPSETTTEEKSSRSYWGFVLVGAVVIVAAAFVFWPRTGGRQQLSLTVHSVRSIHSIDPYSASSAESAYIARVAVTNNTNETLLLGSGAWFFVLRQTKSGWKRQPGGLIVVWADGRLPAKLLPGQGFTVEATIATDRPCRVSVDYLNDRLSGRIWQKLPPWLKAKLSWASPWRTATTEVIAPSKRQ